MITANVRWNLKFWRQPRIQTAVTIFFSFTVYMLQRCFVDPSVTKVVNMFSSSKNIQIIKIQLEVFCFFSCNGRSLLQ